MCLCGCEQGYVPMPKRRSSKMSKIRKVKDFLWSSFRWGLGLSVFLTSLAFTLFFCVGWLTMWWHWWVIALLEVGTITLGVMGVKLCFWILPD